MKQRSRTGRLSQGAQMALVAAALLVVALGGYMLLVKPKHEEASELDTQIAAVQRQIADRRSASTVRQVKVAVKTADLFQLAKAIPEDPSMASTLLELNRVASDAGIVFESITPQPTAAETSYQVQPITLAFRGNFFTLTDFLFRLRQLVQVQDGRLSVTGRLFSVNSVSFGEDADRQFPFVKADVEVSAFVFGGAPTTTPGVPAGDTSTTTSPVTQTTTEPPVQPLPSSGVDAAPATP